MRVYTKTGDDGTTGLFGGGRVSKADVRVEAYGDVDELNSVIGLARAVGPERDMASLLERIQSELFDLGAELASNPARGERAGGPRLADADVARLEQAIDEAEGQLEPLRTFVLPGGNALAAHLHHARTVARRAERHLVALDREQEVRGTALRYLNRLGDLLFVLARLANAHAGVQDVPWIGRDRKDA